MVKSGLVRPCVQTSVLTHKKMIGIAGQGDTTLISQLPVDDDDELGKLGLHAFQHDLDVTVHDAFAVVEEEDS